MYCQMCGNKVKDEAKFCDKCGLKIEYKSELNNKQEEWTNNKIDNAEYNFTKVKQLGALNMFIIRTKVDVDEGQVLIDSRKDYLGFIKGKNDKRIIKIENINNAISKKSIDTIDGIYAIIFLILTLMFVNPAFLLITAVCLWTGYGEKVFINTKENQKVIIHTSGGELTKELVDSLN
ncbi:zinc ribbon domain-containing protein [Clostridium botulinum]|uniref:zinc ribbon domain-containing protein n=1 Tax=Clostridium botulinum TaxID=1491 RepID=UPI001968A504|nr:zinc ribbon domain-containing protein [Clostridium botulinum]MBN1057080.1 zinc ribbon domain-containing protein [Clostridium botulinum]